jgi:hypothetical protein
MSLDGWPMKGLKIGFIFISKSTSGVTGTIRNIHPDQKKTSAYDPVAAGFPACR